MGQHERSNTRIELRVHMLGTFTGTRRTHRAMRNGSWNMRRADDRSPARKYRLNFAPDLALRHEVGETARCSNCWNLKK